jgi:hypothetical protein
MDTSSSHQLLLGVLQPLVRQEVERAVVETADVGDERDLERRGRSGHDIGLRGRCTGAERQRQDRDQRRRRKRHKRAYFHVPSLEDRTTFRRAWTLD